jgi:hypothetical protein
VCEGPGFHSPDHGPSGLQSEELAQLQHILSLWDPVRFSTAASSLEGWHGRTVKDCPGMAALLKPLSRWGCSDIPAMSFFLGPVPPEHYEEAAGGSQASGGQPGPSPLRPCPPLRG